jgi:hypothetical protein
VEVWFLNALCPRLSIAFGEQVTARVGWWFVGGTGFAIVTGLIAMALSEFRPSAFACLVARGSPGLRLYGLI